MYNPFDHPKWKLKRRLWPVHLISTTSESEKVIVVYTSHLANNNIKYLQDLKVWRLPSLLYWFWCLCERVCMCMYVLYTSTQPHVLIKRITASGNWPRVIIADLPQLIIRLRFNISKISLPYSWPFYDATYAAPNIWWPPWKEIPYLYCDLWDRKHVSLFALYSWWSPELIISLKEFGHSRQRTTYYSKNMMSWCMFWNLKLFKWFYNRVKMYLFR